jgi:hypothetical protein
MEQCCGPLAVEMIPGKHCDFSTYLAKRACAQSVACAEVQFPDYLTVLWAQYSRNDSRKELRFQQIFCQESESSVGACAEVLFLDYATELLSTSSRNVSKKSLRFQHLSCQGSEISVWRMGRGAVS